MGVNQGLLLTHQQPLDDSRSPIYPPLPSEDVPERRNGQQRSTSYLNNLLPPKTSSHWSLDRTTQSNLGPGLCTQSHPNVPGEHLAAGPCKPPPHTEEGGAGTPHPGPNGCLSSFHPLSRVTASQKTRPRGPTEGSARGSLPGGHSSSRRSRPPLSNAALFPGQDSHRRLQIIKKEEKASRVGGLLGERRGWRESRSAAGCGKETPPPPPPPQPQPWPSCEGLMEPPGCQVTGL